MHVPQGFSLRAYLTKPVARCTVISSPNGALISSHSKTHGKSWIWMFIFVHCFLFLKFNGFYWYYLLFHPCISCSLSVINLHSPQSACIVSSTSCSRFVCTTSSATSRIYGLIFYSIKVKLFFQISFWAPIKSINPRIVWNYCPPTLIDIDEKNIIMLMSDHITLFFALGFPFVFFP